MATAEAYSPPCRETNVPPPMSKTRVSHLKPLTGLRFLAALFVLLHHYHVFAPTSFVAHGVLNTIAGFGYVGVPFFFVLSGFILAYNYLDANGRMRGSLREFWVARFARIYPVYALAFVIAAVPFFWSSHLITVSLVNGLATLTLAQAWLPHSSLHSWNPPAWSLSVEALFYLAFPFSALAIARLGRRQLCTTLIMLWLASLLMALLYIIVQPDEPHWTQDSTWYTEAGTNPLVRLPEFLMGVVLGRLFVVKAAAKPITRKASIFPPRQEPILALVGMSALALVGLFAIALASAHGMLHGHKPILYLPVHNGLLTPLFGLTIYYLARNRGRLSTVLSVPAVLILGEASYAMYILHYPIGQWMSHYLKRTPGGDAMGRPVMFLVYLAVVIGLSILSLYCVEHPARRWIRKIFASRHRAPASPTDGPSAQVPLASSKIA